jgi:hypothetical protein
MPISADAVGASVSPPQDTQQTEHTRPIKPSASFLRIGPPDDATPEVAARLAQPNSAIGWLLGWNPDLPEAVLPQTQDAPLEAPEGASDRPLTRADIENAFRSLPWSDVPPEEAPVIRDIGRLSQYVYQRKSHILPGDWSTCEVLANQLSNAMALPRPVGGVDRGDGTAMDEGSGFTATVFDSRQARTVVITFGGLLSGPVAGAFEELFYGNNTVEQLKSCIEAWRGSLPKNFQQAAQAVQSLGELMTQAEPYSEYTLCVAGHSKGAIEAIIGALSQPSPPPVYAYSPFYPSESQIWRLPPSNVRRARDIIRICSVEHDLVPGLRKVPGLGIRGLGTEYVVPADRRKGNSYVQVHMQFSKHLDSATEAMEAPAADRAVREGSEDAAA